MNENKKEGLGDRLKKELTERNIRYDEFAEMINALPDPFDSKHVPKATKSLISDICNDGKMPKSGTLYKMCLVLDVSSDWLLGLKEKESLTPDVNCASELTGLSTDTIRELSLLNAYLAKDIREQDALNNDPIMLEVINRNMKRNSEPIKQKPFDQIRLRTTTTLNQLIHDEYLQVIGRNTRYRNSIDEWTPLYALSYFYYYFNELIEKKLGRRNINTLSGIIETPDIQTAYFAALKVYDTLSEKIKIEIDRISEENAKAIEKEEKEYQEWEQLQTDAINAEITAQEIERDSQEAADGQHTETE